MIQLVRAAAIATALSTAATTVAFGQRSRGTMGAPPASPPTTASPAPAPPPPPSRGTMYVPMHPSPNAPRSRGLPRIVTEPPRRPISGFGYTYGSGTGYNTRDRGVDRDRGGDRDRGDRATRWRAPYTRWGVGSVCNFGCVRFAGGLRAGRVLGTFMIGYPFAVPVVVPYIYDATYVRYGEAPAEAYAPAPAEPEPPRAASKLIVIGTGTGGGGDALTVETIGDSVRLSWLGAGRPAREVKLFVSDSAHRQLASRSASPAAPAATFEVATLSAPVAFAGVAVTFTDGVTSTTVVPYRSGAPAARRR